MFSTQIKRCSHTVYFFLSNCQLMCPGKSIRVIWKRLKKLWLPVYISWFSVSDPNIHYNHNDIYKSTFVHSCFMFGGHDLIAYLSFLFFSLVNNWHFSNKISCYFLCEIMKEFLRWSHDTILQLRFSIKIYPLFLLLYGEKSVLYNKSQLRVDWK